MLDEILDFINENKSHHTEWDVDWIDTDILIAFLEKLGETECFMTASENKKNLIKDIKKRALQKFPNEIADKKHPMYSFQTHVRNAYMEGYRENLDYIAELEERLGETHHDYKTEENVEQIVKDYIKNNLSISVDNRKIHVKLILEGDVISDSKENV